ncbi:uncharacterized protein B0H18DRAFT_1187895 [Fomitopsis serialis]|uniref:uncharacterized protein n=1 Tax=Fomitopsis serialis TaxID=139415 RepID=UPI0020086D38|nr:uncharacterized protein B0H18DRAFT_1187895 [Neoantrodia serialis]KAH9934214.1 hypothetical protein B0H18DRAFT_1187895 [Neoantrodia serialis]
MAEAPPPRYLISHALLDVDCPSHRDCHRPTFNRRNRAQKLYNQPRRHGPSSQGHKQEVEKWDVIVPEESVIGGSRIYDHKKEARRVSQSKTIGSGKAPQLTQCATPVPTTPSSRKRRATVASGGIEDVVNQSATSNKRSKYKRESAASAARIERSWGGPVSGTTLEPPAVFKLPPPPRGHTAGGSSSTAPEQVPTYRHAEEKQCTQPVPSLRNLAFPGVGLQDSVDPIPQPHPTDDPLPTSRPWLLPAIDIAGSEWQRPEVPRAIKPLPRWARISTGTTSAQVHPQTTPSPGSVNKGESLTMGIAPGAVPSAVPSWSMATPDYVNPHTAGDLPGWHSSVSSEGLSQFPPPIFTAEPSDAATGSSPLEHQSPSMPSADSDGYTSTGYGTPASSNPAISDTDDDDGDSEPFEPSGKDPTFWRWMDAVYVRLGEKLETHYQPRPQAPGKVEQLLITDIDY